ncbi:hypothetical protein SAY86_026961 [Trapa natans]|uniref:Protein kinase domain-containing protein n=1 Tax=Trapa natans TaxID=22666 RepID=A0AAN7QIJ9_TRANT|nr:hypothetical protein SAY86_026961 [Trapa natans]
MIDGPILIKNELDHQLKFTVRPSCESYIIVTHEVLTALVYLHGQGHLHRDVKVLLMVYKMPLLVLTMRERHFSKEKDAAIPEQNKAFYKDKEKLSQPVGVGGILLHYIRESEHGTFH